MILQRMVYRLYTERATTTTNDWGTKSAPVWSDNLSGVSCWIYPTSGGQRDTQQAVKDVYQYTMVVPKDRDILDGDRVKQITDKLGNVKYGRMKIIGILDRREYKEVLLTAWSGE